MPQLSTTFVCQHSAVSQLIGRFRWSRAPGNIRKRVVCQAQRDVNRAQQLKSKAKLLKQQQQQLTKQLQELSAEAEELTDQEQQEVQDELLAGSDSDPGYVDIPRPVKEFLAGAGVLNALPWDGQPAVTSTTNIPYCQPPADQSYDWDYSSDTLEDAVEGHSNNDTVVQAGQEEEQLQEEDSSEESDDEGGFPEDDKAPFEAGAGVEEIMKMLEEGGTLPDIEGLATAEDPQEFQKRVQKLVDRYEAQYQKKRDRKISTAEIREMEKEEAWEPTGRVPVLDEDILEVRPAPAVPDDIQRQYDALQQCMLVLRSAHLSGKPDQPVKALAAAGLLDTEHVTYQDVLTDLSGVDSWLQYVEGISMAGGWTQVEHVWADVSNDRPNPVYKILVDQYVNVPFPDWYWSYLQDNALPQHWNEAGELEVPALYAVHNSAPEDPSIPLQQAYTAQSASSAPTQNSSGQTQPGSAQTQHSSAQAQDRSAQSQQGLAQPRHSSAETQQDTTQTQHGSAAASKQQPGHSTTAQTQTSSAQQADRLAQGADGSTNAVSAGQAECGEDLHTALHAADGIQAKMSLLPFLRELQTQRRSDSSVRVAPTQNPQQVAVVDEEFPKVCYTDEAFASKLMENAASPAVNVMQKLQERNDTLLGSDLHASAVHSDASAVHSEQNLTQYDSQDAQLPALESVASPQHTDINIRQQSNMEDVTQYDSDWPSEDADKLQSLKFNVGHMRWQQVTEEEVLGSTHESSAPFLPNINLLQQFGDLGSAEQPAQAMDSAAQAGQESDAQYDCAQQPAVLADGGNCMTEVQKVHHKKIPVSQASIPAQHGAELDAPKPAISSMHSSDPPLDHQVAVDLSGAQVLMSEGEWQRTDEKAPAGTAWTHGDCMTFGTTTEYEMSAVSRKIVSVSCGWATVDAYAFEVQDVIDVYIKTVCLDWFGVTK